MDHVGDTLGDQSQMEGLLNTSQDWSAGVPATSALGQPAAAYDNHPLPGIYLTAAMTTPSGTSVEATSPEFTWKPDGFAQDLRYQTYREELRDLIFNAAQSTAPTRAGSPAAEYAGETTQRESGLGSRRSRHETVQILSCGQRIQYLKNYISSVAPWLDMFDTDRAFGLKVPALARTSPALLFAILGISARQIERKEGRQNSFESLELYQEAIRLLAPLLLERNLVIIPICVMLCVLEMLSASAEDWRRHLEGCAALFGNFGIHGFSGGLLQAVFWCYARMDLCGALISDGTQSTLVPPLKWLMLGADPRAARELFTNSNNPDMYANYAVWLCARVCELVFERTRYLELGEQNGCVGDAFATRWSELWDELQLWLAECPAEFHPIRTIETKPFPQALYPHWAAISSTQLYHTACMLLLGVMPKQRLSLGMQGFVIWHSKRICGISLANAHHGCLNNALQPIWLAGRVLSHKSEHDQIVKLVLSIETLTGWGTCWRIADLEAAWGYRVRRADSRRHVLAQGAVAS